MTTDETKPAHIMFFRGICTFSIDLLSSECSARLIRARSSTSIFSDNFPRLTLAFSIHKRRGEAVRRSASPSSSSLRTASLVQWSTPSSALPTLHRAYCIVILGHVNKPSVPCVKLFTSPLTGRIHRRISLVAQTHRMTSIRPNNYPVVVV